MIAPFRILPVLAALACGVTASTAAPAPYDPARFAFPGSVTSPGDAASAGLAGTDRWVSAVPGGNPAAAPAATGVTLSPILQRISRQDLSAANRDFSQTTLFADLAGGQLALRAGRWAVRLEAGQPVLRRETSTFGIAAGDAPPARIRVDAEAREARASLAVSLEQGAWRLGAAGEYARRSDRYATTEVSGSPDAGDRELSFDGSSAGGALGAVWSHTPESRGGLVLGAGVRMIGALTGDFTSVSDLLSGTTSVRGDAGRDALLEAGLTARVTVDERGGHAWMSLEHRGAERWPGLAVETRAAASWRAGYSYRDVSTPWVVRIGIGQDVQPGAPEPRATAVGVGVGWADGDLAADLGVTNRSIHRAGSPTLADTRVVASLRVGF